MQRIAQNAGKGASRNRVNLGAAGRVHCTCVVILLAVSLMLSGMAAAMPFAKAPGGEVFVICAEGGSTRIYIDQYGNPVAPMKDCANCPDCLAPFALPATPSRGLSDRRATYRPGQATAHDLSVPAPPYLRPETRGPPSVVSACLDVAPVGRSAGTATKDNQRLQSACGWTQPANPA